MNQEAKHVANGVAHFDICGPSFASLCTFYKGVFGWSIVDRGPGYASVSTPSGTADGAIVEAEEAALTIGVVVPAIADALEAALANGGTISMPITDNGWVVKAQIVDPAGNRVTLIQA